MKFVDSDFQFVFITDAKEFKALKNTSSNKAFGLEKIPHDYDKTTGRIFPKDWTNTCVGPSGVGSRGAMVVRSPNIILRGAPIFVGHLRNSYGGTMEILF